MGHAAVLNVVVVPLLRALLPDAVIMIADNAAVEDGVSQPRTHTSREGREGREGRDGWDGRDGGAGAGGPLGQFPNSKLGECPSFRPNQSGLQSCD